jgi:predicted aldo/keto reductase-like oxidoreductase
VSAIALGTKYLINLSRETVSSVIHTAIERGINYFDLFFAQSDIKTTGWVITSL